MSDRRTNDVIELALEYAVFLTSTRGITQALEYVDAHNIDRVLFWRVLSDPEQSRRRDRRERARDELRAG